MQTKDFYFDLPEELIAQQPCPERGHDRLMRLDRKTGIFSDHRFEDIVSLIAPGTLMVFNDSRVRKARVYATADSSGHRTEFLLIAMYPLANKSSGTVWKVMAKNAKRQKPGRSYTFEDGRKAVIIADSEGKLERTEFRLIEFERPIDDVWLEEHGHLPLPPYIRREDEPADADRYQTVYARTTGSVAAPTAGLHFTKAVLDALQTRGVEQTMVTLHVGLGTFLPVRAANIEDHVMHEETYSVSEETAEKVDRAKKEGRPVLAVGTTSIRTLESAWDEEAHRLRVGTSSTHIFIYPGFTFHVVDKVFTNFHTPESTLLMLVSAFAGREHIMHAYQHAITERYHFFSYGDSMLID